ncbi:hypothetical protein AN216_20100 [Streptomyces oceani]|uniref:TrbL/VirB6 plasmid conjugal transfer protein n=1 Tax=Streptomyces oceani TaxID=1075402 RepID=A0A1E7JY27_9ACTN|nr:hypothetical protein AN216_20100 [Streptomyces oceani]
MIGNVVEAFASALGEAAESFMTWLNKLWLGIEADGSGTSIHDIQNELDWLVGYVAVASLLFAAMRMALDRKGQSMQQAFQGMWRVILVSGMATGVVMALSSAADSYAMYIYEKPRGDKESTTLLGGALVALAKTSPGLIIVFGLLAIVAALVQALLMLLRIGAMVMLVGTLPLAAAASMTGWGGGWWKKHIGWLIAWLLYKPAAALVFFCGQVMMDNAAKSEGEPEITQAVAGLATLILAVFALPALLKLLVPATAALGNTSGGSVTLNAANTVATGAVSIAGGGMSGGGGGKGGGEGPKGSPSSASAPSSGGAGSGGAGGGAGGASAGGASAGGAAAGGAAAAGVQAAAVAAQATTQAATEVTNSFDDNDGNKGHNE